MVKHDNTRIESIDVLRGLALALMLLVNNPGSWSSVYSPFLHADWHGLTPTDLVFPFFLFVVGASMACSLRPRVLSKQSLVWPSIFKRALILFTIGVLLQAIPFNEPLSEWRIPGVLQRIALCFLIVAVIISAIKEKYLLIASVFVLIIYWLLSFSFGDNPHSLQNNLVRYIDIAVLGENHLYQGKGLAFDPEGLFSTLSASITVLSGYIVVSSVFSIPDKLKQISRLFSIGLVLLATGYLWSIWYPINKSLWTSSFVLVCSAYACISLAVIIFLEHHTWTKTVRHVLKVYGSNPILIYVLAWIAAVLLGQITFGEQSMSVQGYFYSSLSQIVPEKLASLIYAVLFTCAFYALSHILYQKKIFVKI